MIRKARFSLGLRGQVRYDEAVQTSYFLVEWLFEDDLDQLLNIHQLLSMEKQKYVAFSPSSDRLRTRSLPILLSGVDFAPFYPVAKSLL